MHIPRRHIHMRWIVLATIACAVCSACSPEHPRERAPAADTVSMLPKPEATPAPSLYGPGIHVLTSCPTNATTCVRMTLDDHARPSNAPLPSADSTGYANITLRVRGHLSGQSSVDTVLVLRSNTDGIACSALGNATVAVTGFTDAGGAIVLTSAGPFTVDSSSLAFGCETCGVLLQQSARDTVATLRTPAWDLQRVGITPEALSYDDARTVFVRTSTSCVAMRASGPFDAVNSALCIPMIELGSSTHQVKNFKLKPAEWLYQATGQRMRLLLSRGACT